MRPLMMRSLLWKRMLEKLDKDMEANATNSMKLREIMEAERKHPGRSLMKKWTDGCI